MLRHVNKHERKKAILIKKNTLYKCITRIKRNDVSGFRPN